MPARFGVPASERNQPAGWVASSRVISRNSLSELWGDEWDDRRMKNNLKWQ